MNHAEIVALIYEELLKVAGGATVVIAGLSGFLGKVWIDRVAKKEARKREAELTKLRSELEQQGKELQAQLDVSVQRIVHVDKVQFEHEYEIYRKAWESLFDLRQATLSLRPMLDHVERNESKEERMHKRIGQFSKPHNKFLQVVEMNKPFYPEAVYSALGKVREKCREELISYQYTERGHREYWEEASKNQEEILVFINSACEAIRTRISEVRVR